MEQNLQQKRQYNLKDVCIIYVLSILLYLVLSLVIGLLLQQNLPQGITDVSYFSTRVWYPLVSFSAFPISFILVVIFYSCFCKLSVARAIEIFKSKKKKVTANERNKVPPIAAKIIHNFLLIPILLY